MKSRPEFESIFASPAMFFRALHTVSTQRYRLPVRRYIMDLFTIELDAEVVAALSEAAKSMKAHPSFKPSKESNRVSMFGPLGRPRRSSESDDEAELTLMTSLRSNRRGSSSLLSVCDQSIGPLDLTFNVILGTFV